MTNNGPNILLIDVETSPNLGYTWGKYEQNVIKFEKESEVLCFAAKWLNDPVIYTCKRETKSNKNIARELWLLLNKADIIIAHNGDRFDIRVINACLLKNKLPPPSSFKTVDTKKVARRYFALNSNKLDDIGETLDLGRKLKHEGIELWLSCMAGDEKAWERMLEYNVQDLKLLEKIYLKLRPWISNHPNYNHYTEARSKICPKCGNKQSKSYGLYRAGGLKQKRRCNKCLGFFYISLVGSETIINA